ncbi:MerR family transcriptional regulator [Mesobacillus boroniphilus]|uniref:MerR family transcriptional regulator n=1 Tax=Mesobacillus boroniphilus TaxID=308892 RepID=A0A944GXE5_9BACI|nr:MerR family transcriptional regulator [Mesobacillus boroniphilus]MBS8264351.1 MerR family transcriptional regulator [Mesobacillus boroniphilus]
MYKVKEVAEMTGVSVRTLHHYDRIGLLKPEAVSSVGYRLYSKENLERLQQILVFKEMDFSLHEIKDIIERPEFNRRENLKKHKELLLAKKKRLEGMIRTVEMTIDSIEGGYQMANKDMFKGFDMKEIEEHQKKYSEEAKERYGKETVENVEKKTAGYSSEDWGNIQGKTDEIYKRIIAGMDHGPEDPGVQRAVSDWRQFITDHYYDCRLDIFRGLGDLYVDDPRFTKNIDKYQQGLAAFFKEAIHYYCDQQEK